MDYFLLRSERLVDAVIQSDLWRALESRSQTHPHASLQMLLSVMDSRVSLRIFSNTRVILSELIKESKKSQKMSQHKYVNEENKI